MTPAEMAALHAVCFTTPRPWTTAEFTSLLASPGVFCLSHPQGFALGRVVLDEAEVLTFAVAPEARRKGFGRRLLQQFDTAAMRRGACAAFLEVSAANTAARALYMGHGFTQTGLRKEYYRTPEGLGIDAIVMARALGSGETTPQPPGF